MDELVQILDSNGQPTGQTALKSEAHQKGLFHPTVHVWFYTPNWRILIQQRAQLKEIYPLLWDVSVAGHVVAGEEIIQAAIREVQEEIGLTINKNELEKIGVFKSVHKHNEKLIDCEFHHTFLSAMKVSFNRLEKHDREVEAIQLIPLIQFSEEIWGLANPSKYVPHEPEYYKTVIREIKKRL